MSITEWFLLCFGMVGVVAGLLALSEWERRMRMKRDNMVYWADRHRARGAPLVPVARVTLKPRLVPMPDWVPKGDDSRSN